MSSRSILILVVLTIISGSVMTLGQEESVTVPAGTRLRAKLNSTVGTKNSRIGDGIEAVLIEPVRVNGLEVLPQGTYLSGRIEAVRSGDKKQRVFAMLRPSFTKVTLPDGSKFDVRASVQSLGTTMDVDPEGAVTERRESKGEKVGVDAATVGAGAGVGGIAAGGKGAAVGAGVGAGIAALGELADALTKYEDFELKKGRKLWLRLDQDLVVAPTTRSPR
ncbi:MAG TPA: hypothetical protein VFD30_06700 [Terriglobia bacterium]|jgi:hypothetical protein|nr:hypothetical protein [Terriglobia bacterium]